MEKYVKIKKKIKIKPNTQKIWGKMWKYTKKKLLKSSPTAIEGFS